MAFRIPLKPISGGFHEPHPYSVADVEAWKWTQFRVMGWYNGDEYHEFRHLAEFVDFIFERDEKIIYAHFGGIYDFLFFIQAIIENTTYKIIDIIPRGSGMLCFTVDAGFRKITFRDSSAILPFSLKNITESFGVRHVKGDFDFEKWDGSITDELLHYLRHDCIGLWESLNEYFRWPLIERVGAASTMASQALKVFRLFMHKEIKALTSRVDAFVRSGYFGGRTEIFRPQYFGKKKLRCYDVNSLYPTVMRNNDYPTNFKKKTTTYFPEEMGFYEAEVEVPHDMYLPPLPTVQHIGKLKDWAEGEDNKVFTKEYLESDEGSELAKNYHMTTKLIFPTGRFKGVWSTIELEYAKSVGVKVLSTGVGYLFENGGPIFRTYIDTLYDMRLKAKAKGDGVGDILTKLLMNSCYGRFGLNTERDQIVFDDFQTGVKPHSELKIMLDGKERIIRLMTEKVSLDKTFTNVAISAWVTSLARIHMHKIMLPVQDELYYTDTDSLFTTAELETGEGLGELKEEYVCDKAVFLLPKTYVVEGEDHFKKLAMKGFDKKKISKFSYEDFFTALEGDLRNMKVLHDAKFAKFKTAAKKGNLTTLLPPQEKAIRSSYDKRIILRNGRDWNTEPLRVANMVP